MLSVVLSGMYNKLRVNQYNTVDLFTRLEKENGTKFVYDIVELTIRPLLK